ncbi:hypothetical protein H9Q09_00620 [Aurantimonas sp. DM33-3]|uniref:hypothetical protein n=1 Tax=Aurantimonas sp. DM33-3 TaxID=2766955 RepID=UPI001652907D|nr:hypothetical protein [Aurantimonas sp. DM33-3]MBC6714688.1 hypothetical protein [Aurantimonas sp. DM33-3]
MDGTDLAAKIAAAEHERAIWEAGRRAFCVEGADAFNPHSPYSPDHALWADGFDAERKEKRVPEWLDHGEPARLGGRR